MRSPRLCSALGLTVLFLGVLAGCPMGTLGIPGELDFRVLGWRYALHHLDYGHTIEETSDGGYFVVGHSQPGTESNLQVSCVKLSQAGAAEWYRMVEGLYRQAGQGPRAEGLYTSDGGAVLAGLTADNADSDTLYEGKLRIVRLDSSGDTVWDRICHPDHQWIPQGMARAGDGGFVVSLVEGGFYTTGRSVRLLKVDASGTSVWERELVSTRQYGRLEDLRPTSDGGFVLAGYSVGEGSGTGRYDVTLVRTDANGLVQWWRHYEKPTFEQGFAVDIAPDGGYVVAGTSGPEPYAIRTDSNGNLLWARDDIIDVDTSDPSAPDYEVWDVAVTPDGCIAIAGLGESVTYHGVPFPEIVRGGFILELDPNGNLKWYTQFGERQVSQIFGVTVASDGNYVTTGVTAYAEIQVLKIDRSGNVLN